MTPSRITHDPGTTQNDTSPGSPLESLASMTTTYFSGSTPGTSRSDVGNTASGGTVKRKAVHPIWNRLFLKANPEANTNSDSSVPTVHLGKLSEPNLPEEIGRSLQDANQVDDSDESLEKRAKLNTPEEDVKRLVDGDKILTPTEPSEKRLIPDHPEIKIKPNSPIENRTKFNMKDILGDDQGPRPAKNIDGVQVNTAEPSTIKLKPNSSNVSLNNHINGNEGKAPIESLDQPAQSNSPKRDAKNVNVRQVKPRKSEISVEMKVPQTPLASKASEKPSVSRKSETPTNTNPLETSLDAERPSTSLDSKQPVMLSEAKKLKLKMESRMSKNPDIPLEVKQSEMSGSGKPERPLEAIKTESSSRSQKPGTLLVLDQLEKPPKVKKSVPKSGKHDIPEKLVETKKSQMKSELMKHGISLASQKLELSLNSETLGAPLEVKQTETPFTSEIPVTPLQAKKLGIPLRVEKDVTLNPKMPSGSQMSEKPLESRKPETPRSPSKPTRPVEPKKADDPLEGNMPDHPSEASKPGNSKQSGTSLEAKKQEESVAAKEPGILSEHKNPEAPLKLTKTENPTEESRPGPSLGSTQSGMQIKARKSEMSLEAPKPEKKQSLVFKAAETSSSPGKLKKLVKTRTPNTRLEAKNSAVRPGKPETSSTPKTPEKPVETRKPFTRSTPKKYEVSLNAKQPETSSDPQRFEEPLDSRRPKRRLEKTKTASPLESKRSETPFAQKQTGKPLEAKRTEMSLRSRKAETSSEPTKSASPMKRPEKSVETRKPGTSLDSKQPETLVESRKPITRSTPKKPEVSLESRTDEARLEVKNSKRSESAQTLEKEANPNSLKEDVKNIDVKPSLSSKKCGMPLESKKVEMSLRSQTLEKPLEARESEKTPKSQMPGSSSSSNTPENPVGAKRYTTRSTPKKSDAPSEPEMNKRSLEHLEVLKKLSKSMILRGRVGTPIENAKKCLMPQKRVKKRVNPNPSEGDVKTADGRGLLDEEAKIPTEPSKKRQRPNSLEENGRKQLDGDQVEAHFEPSEIQKVPNAPEEFENNLRDEEIPNNSHSEPDISNEQSSLEARQVESRTASLEKSSEFNPPEEDVIDLLDDHEAGTSPELLEEFSELDYTEEDLKNLTVEDLLDGYDVETTSMQPTIQNALTTVQQQLLFLEVLEKQPKGPRRRRIRKEISTQTPRLTPAPAPPRSKVMVPHRPPPPKPSTSPPEMDWDIPDPTLLPLGVPMESTKEMPPIEDPDVSLIDYFRENPPVGLLREERHQPETTVEDQGKVYTVLEPPPSLRTVPREAPPVTSFAPSFPLVASPQPIVGRVVVPSNQPSTANNNNAHSNPIMPEADPEPQGSDPLFRPKDFVPLPLPRLSKKGHKIGRPLGSFKVYKRAADEVPKEKNDDNERKCLWKACGMKFALQSTFVEHVQTHVIEDGKTYRRCLWEGCNRADPFDAFYKIQYHIRGHTQERSFVCTEPGCNKSYLRMENLTTHIRSHTGERPYECLICGKKFTNASDRACHKKRVHSSDKPYHCCVTNCGRRYTDPSSLRKHFCNQHPHLMKEFIAGKHRAYIRNKEKTFDKR